jgi:hypothetical protein
LCLTLSRYEEAKAKGTENYDRDLEDVIDRLILECDRKITRALRRLEAEDAKAAIAISVSEVTQVMVDSFISYPIIFIQQIYDSQIFGC